ncbi:MAG: DUF2062 domain-containing protein [Nitrospirae bacterium]|nr:DUF2062 domain-containing protein [Nitrospirota bacterium]
MAYLRDKFKSIMQVHETPHRIALAFALGVFMGNSPFLGLHYVGGIFLAWIFRLNKLVAFVGVSVNNPWTIVPISTFSVWLGAKILMIKDVLPEVDWNAMTFTTVMAWLKSLVTDSDNFFNLILDLMPLIKSFFVGSFIVCTLSSIASYFIILGVARRYKKIKHAA